MKISKLRSDSLVGDLPHPVTWRWGFPGGSMVKNPPANAGAAGDAGLVTGSGRSPGGGHGNPLQYSCLENPTGSRAWWALFSLSGSNTLATWCEELTHLKRPWCWERLKAGGEGDDRGWDGWMASPTQWTGVRVNSGSWWWTGRPGVLQSMGSQRVG